MDLIAEKIEKWVLPVSDRSNHILDFIYDKLTDIDYQPAIDQFVRRIDLIDYKFTNDAKVSGAICFFGSIMMSLVQLGYINNIDELFTLSSCYILMDHYLDDNTIPMIDKVKTISQTYKFIDNPTGDNEIESEIIQAVATRYVDMVNKVPSAVDHLKGLFKSEVKSMYLEYQDNLDRETYLESAEMKGGMTCNAIQALLNLEVTNDEFQLGALIQLVDNQLDIEDDMELGIHTIATYDFKNDGNLDKLFIYTVNKIDEMSNKYNIFKPILLLGLILAVHTNRDKYTNNIIELSNKYNYFGSDTTKETLGSMIHKKLFRPQ